jgi:hypothetical protein
MILMLPLILMVPLILMMTGLLLASCVVLYTFGAVSVTVFAVCIAVCLVIACCTRCERLGVTARAPLVGRTGARGRRARRAQQRVLSLAEVAEVDAAARVEVAAGRRAAASQHCRSLAPAAREDERTAEQVPVRLRGRLGEEALGHEDCVVVQMSGHVVLHELHEHA